MRRYGWENLYIASDLARFARALERKALSAAGHPAQMPLLPLVAIAVALVCPPLCYLAEPSTNHSPQSAFTTKAPAGANRDNSTADILSKTSSPKELREKILLQRTPIACQNVNRLGTDAKIREACKTVRENRIPYTQLSSKPTVAPISA
jgi:hypothetical protein